MLALPVLMLSACGIGGLGTSSALHNVDEMDEAEQGSFGMVMNTEHDGSRVWFGAKSLCTSAGELTLLRAEAANEIGTGEVTFGLQMYDPDRAWAVGTRLTEPGEHQPLAGAALRTTCGSPGERPQVIVSLDRTTPMTHFIDGIVITYTDERGREGTLTQDVQFGLCGPEPHDNEPTVCSTDAG